MGRAAKGVTHLPRAADAAPPRRGAGCLREGGLPTPVVAHAYAIVDAFVYGFAVQEASLPGGGVGDEWNEVTETIAAQLPADDLPHLAAFTAEHVLRPGYDFGNSFDVGLDLVLDGIERLAVQHRGG